MRNVRINRLLAGTAMVLAFAGPAAELFAQSSSVRSVAPLPPTMQSGPTHRNVVQPLPPEPPARQRAQRPAPQRDDDAPASRAQAELPRTAAPVEPAARDASAREATPQPAAQASPAVAPVQPATANTGSAGFDIKSTIEKLFAASDSQIADELRARAKGKSLERAFARPAERAAVEKFYAERNYAPLWIKDGALTARAKDTVARLKNARADGLDAADYETPDFANLGNAAALAEGDLKLTASVLEFARHLQTGRIAPRRVLAEVDYGDHTPEPADILRKVSAASDINATLDSFNPPHSGFRKLKAKLAAVSAMASAGEPEGHIASGPALKVGMKDARVPALREKLRVAGKPGDTTYDKKLAYAVKLMQQRAGLSPDGTLGATTLAAINGPKLSQQVDIVAANMERWRWLPRDLGKTYVMVNIPDYTLKVARGDEIVWQTKIVAGKPNTQTPLTSGPMHEVIVNPSWYVPQSIIQNELLPLYDSDPKIFERMGLEVKRGPDGHINVVQPPGAANALGHIKFAFHNKFQVYLHDTPEKRLFAQQRRAYSHGCMRVEDPTKFGEVILSLAMKDAMPNSRQIAQMYGQDQKSFKLQQRPMVHLTYQTAFVDENDRLQLRDDVYGFDQRIHAILSGAERRIADVAPPPEVKRDFEQLRSNQEALRRVERREASNPFVFFERLFR
ncbi:MAG: L,D-transpeptidase family protein [Pseudolabrys sp.]